jgi:hypothetical protein
MVTEKNLLSAPLVRYRLGIVLIWLGVLTWVPFILLRIAGEKPSLFWYLPFHLIGVIGGARLRSVARRELGISPESRNIWRILGHGLILTGVAVWAPYFYLKLAAGVPVNVLNYLPFHLGGIFAGLTFLAIGHWVSKKRELDL